MDGCLLFSFRNKQTNTGPNGIWEYSRKPWRAHSAFGTFKTAPSSPAMVCSTCRSSPPNSRENPWNIRISTINMKLGSERRKLVVLHSQRKLIQKWTIVKMSAKKFECPQFGVFEKSTFVFFGHSRWHDNHSLAANDRSTFTSCGRSQRDKLDPNYCWWFRNPKNHLGWC